MGAGFGVAPTSPKARPQHGPGMAEASHGPAGAHPTPAWHVRHKSRCGP